MDKSGDNCGEMLENRGITSGKVRQNGCEKIKLDGNINFMARACHLLGTVSIFVAEVGRGGWPCGESG